MIGLLSFVCFLTGIHIATYWYAVLQEPTPLWELDTAVVRQVIRHQLTLFPIAFTPILMGLDLTFCWYTELLKWAGMLVLYDVFFGIVHYAAHKYFWPLHKEHHSLYQASSALYGSWQDILFVNYLPFAAALYCVNASWVSCVLYAVIGTHASVHSHSHSITHAAHHILKTVNFGDEPFFLYDRYIHTFMDAKTASKRGVSIPRRELYHVKNT